MAIKISEGNGEYKNVPAGVYDAVLRKEKPVDDETKTYEWSKNPRAFIHFEVSSKDVTGDATYSVEVGDELRFVVKALTRRDVTDFESAKKALASCQWKGKVQVGKTGFVTRLQLPLGNYRFRFGRFSSRDSETGKPRIIPMEGKNGAYQIVFYDSVVTEGDYAGWVQTDSIPVKFNQSGRNISFSDKSAFAGLAIATGIDQEQCADIEIEDGEDPIETVERAMLRMADLGWTYFGAVDPDGRISWKKLSVGGFQKNSGEETEREVISYMEALYKKCWGKSSPVETVTDGKRKLTDAGRFIAANVLKIAATASPSLMIGSVWPPASWGIQGMVNASAIMSDLSGMDEGELMMKVGDTPETHSALHAWVRDNYASAEEGEAF